MCAVSLDPLSVGLLDHIYGGVAYVLGDPVQRDDTGGRVIGWSICSHITSTRARCAADGRLALKTVRNRFGSLRSRQPIYELRLE
mgnify:CR=1 FL=1